jgi:hypothetical protein
MRESEREKWISGENGARNWSSHKSLSEDQSRERFWLFCERDFEDKVAQILLYTVDE